MLVAMVFLICWTPFYSISLISQLQQSSFLQKSQFLFTMLAAHWTGFLNSCLNPFIYSAMSNKFRRNFKQMLLRCVCCCSHLKQSRKRRRHHFECQILDKSCRFIAYEDICAVVGGRECAELKIFPDTTGLSWCSWRCDIISSWCSRRCDIIASWRTTIWQYSVVTNDDVTL